MLQRIIIILLSWLLHTSAFSQVDIWEGVPHKPIVKMTPYLISGSRHPAVIICPGGSYFWHDTKHEGSEVAEWLRSNGISAFVLNYRTACTTAFLSRFRYVLHGNRYPDPQDDLRQAIRYVKSHGRQWGIDSTRIGVMGFSAGGHLVMSAAELFDKEDRPAFIASVYPVVTMTEACVHKRSRRGLLGESRIKNKELKDLLSLEKHVPADCPPVFLINCKDDPIVDYRNSLLLDSALTSQHVRHQYLLYETGGHGFGASETKGTAECRQWKAEFIKWMEKLKN